MLEPTWITIHGVHIPLYNGESPFNGAKRFFESKHGKDIAKLLKNKDKDISYEKSGSNGKYKIVANKNKTNVGFIRYNEVNGFPEVVYIKVEQNFRHKRNCY